MSVFCVERQKWAAAEGLCYCALAGNGQERRILHIVQRPNPVRNDGISQSPSPSAGSGVNGRASQTKYNRVLGLYMQGNYVGMHAIESLLDRLYH